MTTTTMLGAKDERMCMGKRKKMFLDHATYRATHWVGTTQSLIIHTIFFFVIILSGKFIGLTDMLLILTTAVSLEAIYLSIFIQMSINRHGEKLKDVHDDLEDVAEDIEDLTEEDLDNGKEK